MLFKKCPIPFEGQMNIKLGNFNLKEVLGKGSFGVVYRARSKLTNNNYAIKCIDKSKVIEDLSSIERELIILMNIKHENIMKFYNYFEDEKRFYIVTEYAEKGNLYSILN